MRVIYEGTRSCIYRLETRCEYEHDRAAQARRTLYLENLLQPEEAIDIECMLERQSREKSLKMETLYPVKPPSPHCPVPSANPLDLAGLVSDILMNIVIFGVLVVIYACWLLVSL